MSGGFKEKLQRHFILFLARRLPACQEITALLSESLERPTTAREKIVTKLHLFTCKYCQRYLKQINLLHNLRHIKEVADETRPTVTLSNEARTRIRAALEGTRNGES